MSAEVIQEIIGYAGSALIVLSLSMKSILRLRLVGLAGAITFLIYGLLISAYPIVITNVVIIGIQFFFLRQLLGKKPVFSVLEVRQGSAYLEHFIEHWAADIAKFRPEFRYEPKPNRYRAFILRDMVPAGLFICDLGDGDTAVVQLDYVIPAYADLKVGRYLYSSASSVFNNPGINRVLSPPGSPKHNAYLERMGYQKKTGGDGKPMYELHLTDLESQAGRKTLPTPDRRGAGPHR